MDIYKADEWELKRDDLILGAQIGRGTFGKVIIILLFFYFLRFYAVMAKILNL